jgi:FMN phosphatase YigB (HAD superfamily)
LHPSTNDSRFRDVPLYPDVMPAQTALAQDYRLGLRSNGNGNPERSGLAAVFSVVILSQDHGCKKARPAALCNIAASEAQLPSARLEMMLSARTVCSAAGGGL